MMPTMLVSGFSSSRLLELFDLKSSAASSAVSFESRGNGFLGV